MTTEDLVLDTFVRNLAENEQPFVFKAANSVIPGIPYELSGTGKGLGNQLTNASDSYAWKVKRLATGVYAIESVSSPGLFIGAGSRRGVGATSGYEAVLVSEGDRKALMCLKPARNGSNMHISFACIEEPKYLLNHCNGLMWYFKEPANAEYYFSNDSSWSLEPVETPETRVQRMPTMRREVSENSTGACPICFEPWGDEALKVVTECDHTICITCIINICALRPPLTEGNCAQCRATVRLDNLNRVIDVDRVDQFSEGDIKTSDPSLEGNEHDSEEPAAVSEVSQVFTSNYQEILDSWEAGDWEESIRERSDRSY